MPSRSPRGLPAKAGNEEPNSAKESIILPLATNQDKVWGARQSISGWGRSSASASASLAVSGDNQESDFIELLNSNSSLRLIPRGMGRSYGDAAMCAGGHVTDHSCWKSTFELDPINATLEVSSGYSLHEIMERTIPKGFFLSVTPGTRYVSAGGAFAADIHGKNHHHDGSFGTTTRSIRLLAPLGIFDLYPGDPYFDATLGGMGLTGFISKMNLSLIPIQTSYVKVTSKRTLNLAHTLSEMEAHDDEHRYSVAWIDCTIGGKSMGRSIITWGDHAKVEDLETKQLEDPLTFHGKELLKAPDIVPSWLLNHYSVRLFNELWYQRARLSEGETIASIPSYFHPLDGLGEWNRLYGSRGFLQYQFVLPLDAQERLHSILHTISNSPFASFLAVLKRFGGPSSGMLSFPIQGWTLALDLPARRKGLSVLLDAIDLEVTQAGGRVYLAKDSRVSPELIQAMYPRLAAWQEYAAELDPLAHFDSDLSQRLHLRRERGSDFELSKILPVKSMRGPKLC